MRYVKQTVSALSVALISIASAYVMDVDEVMGEEVYNVQLKVETVEVDINEIPENREIEVGISIDNNPGFLGLSYLVEIDGRLTYDRLLSYSCNLDLFSLYMVYFDNNPSVINLGQTLLDFSAQFHENTRLSTIKLVLPDELCVGDFFEIKLLSMFSDDSKTCGVCFRRENSFDSFYGPENFAPFINGGIRIVGQEPEPVQEPTQESEPPVQPLEPEIAPPQPAEDNQQNNNVQQKDITETPAPVTEVPTTETTTETTSTTTVTTVLETTVSTTVSTTETEKTTTEETTVLETTVTEVSENNTDDGKEKKNIIPIIVAGIAVITAVITGVIFRKKKENKDEKK